MILNLNRNVLKRYENNLKDGTVFLYNMESDKTWVGNTAADCLLRLIDGQTPLDEIYKILFPLFEGFDYKELEASFNLIIEELLKEGFIENNV